MIIVRKQELLGITIDNKLKLLEHLHNFYLKAKREIVSINENKKVLRFL